MASLGVIRMVLAPPAIMFSMAVTWPALSPSVLPAADNSLAPSFFASASAPSFIFTKKGLESVLVIRPMTGWACAWASDAARASTAKAPADVARVEARMVMFVSSGGRDVSGITPPDTWGFHEARCGVVELYFESG
ncbi:hypothetical protein D9M69_663130 [compost metagenome]